MDIIFINEIIGYTNNFVRHLTHIGLSTVQDSNLVI
jgi:hypothetical protein